MTQSTDLDFNNFAYLNKHVTSLSIIICFCVTMINCTKLYFKNGFMSYTGRECSHLLQLSSRQNEVSRRYSLKYKTVCHKKFCVYTYNEANLKIQSKRWSGYIFSAYVATRHGNNVPACNNMRSKSTR